jgi:hypothetical protein
MSCGFENQEEFWAEIAFHPHGLPSSLVMFIFPRILVLVCMNCGRPQFAKEFVIPNKELRLLSKRVAASA